MRLDKLFMTCSTPFGIRGENRPRPFRDKKKFEGAQRLSASEGKTALELSADRGDRGVLNAFRHQRGKQNRDTDSIPLKFRCSTPFGIRGENSY